MTALSNYDIEVARLRQHISKTQGRAYNANYLSHMTKTWRTARFKPQSDDEKTGVIWSMDDL